MEFVRFGLVFCDGTLAQIVRRLVGGLEVGVDQGTCTHDPALSQFTYGVLDVLVLVLREGRGCSRELVRRREQSRRFDVLGGVQSCC